MTEPVKKDTEPVKAAVEPDPPIPGLPAAIPALLTYLAKYGATPILLALFCFMLYSNWSDMRAVNKDNAVAIQKIADAELKQTEVLKDLKDTLERLNGAMNRISSKLSPGKDKPPLFSEPGT